MIKTNFYPLYYFFKRNPFTGCFIIFALLISGIIDGIGILALMPLLQFVLEGDSAANSQISQFFDSIFGFFGFEISFLGTLLFIISLITAKAVIKLSAMYIISLSAAEMIARFRLQLVDAIMKAKWQYFTEKEVGHISTAINNEPQTAANCVIRECNFVAEAIQISVYLVIAILISWKMTLGAIVLGGGATLFLKPFFQKAKRAGQTQTDYQKALLADILDSLKAMKSIRAMARESYFLPHIERSIKKLKYAYKWISFSPHIIEQVNEVLKVVVLAIGLYLFIELWGSELGQIIILSLVFLRTAQRLNLLQKNYVTFVACVPSFSYTIDTIREAQSSQESWAGTKDVLFDKEIIFQDAWYSHKENEILKNASFKIKKNCLTMIMGPSGVGKSTLVDLICGLYGTDSGEIYVGQSNLKEIDILKWRSKIGYVPQNSVLFNDTIRNNITLYDKSIGEQEIEIVLEQSGAIKFVESLKDGLETKIGESGDKLSGGQKQRLALARALIKKPELLILDEATTGLDPVTEKAIFHKLKSLAKNLTIIVITHSEHLKSYADDAYIFKDKDLKRI